MGPSLYASELRRAREAAGMTQEQLAETMNYSVSAIQQVENDRKPPSEAFTQRADEVLKTDGLLGRIREHSRSARVVPDWFRSWPEIERQATALRSYEPLLVPGLLQIEEYARALLVDEDRVALRMDRQKVLIQDEPPELIVLLDEVALYRKVGSPEVMHRQLLHLTDTAALVQVLPREADTYLGMDGSFVIASLDGREIVYVDTPARGFVLDDPEVVSAVKIRWDTIRGEVLPRRHSADLILKAAESWTESN